MIVLARSPGTLTAQARRNLFHDFIPRDVREAILRVANVGATTSAEISQLNFLLGELFARAVARGAEEISRHALQKFR